MASTPRHYASRVVSVDDVLPDTRRIFVEIDNRQRLPFMAGQYVRLSLPGFDDRAFSIASAPHEPLLEFHIKNSGQGLSAYIVKNLKIGGSIGIDGPYGVNHWRPADRPLLAIAGGLGIAPMKSIIDACLHMRAHPPLHLYWGARHGSQLYLDHYFRALSKKHAHFSYVSVLPEGEETQKKTGLPGEVVAEEFDTLAGMSIYMAGPDAMAHATLPLLLKKGAEEEHIFSDSLTR